MKPSDRDQFRRKLTGDLEAAEGEVARLFSQRQVFEEITRVFNQNTTLRAEWTELHTLLFGGYVAQACLRLRRLMDLADPKQTVSLANIATRLCEHPEIITRDAYVSRFTRNTDVRLAGCHDDQACDRFRSIALAEREREANRRFDQFAGERGSCVDPRRLCRFCLPAKCKCATVLTYVDKRLAHYDRAIPEDPTWGELDEAIDAVGDLYIRMQVLLTGVVEERKDLAGTWQGAAWEPLIEVPWRTRVQAGDDLLPSN